MYVSYYVDYESNKNDIIYSSEDFNHIVHITFAYAELFMRKKYKTYILGDNYNFNDDRIIKFILSMDTNEILKKYTYQNELGYYCINPADMGIEFYIVKLPIYINDVIIDKINKNYQEMLLEKYLPHELNVYANKYLFSRKKKKRTKNRTN
jgi:hypothetical protein